MKTTLNKIRAHRPCREGWEKLLRAAQAEELRRVCREMREDGR